MARVVDLTGENLTRQRRKERNYGTKTDLSSTTVERGNTHWAEGSNVNIDGFLGVAGTQRVTGLLDVTGTFNGSGTNNMDGTNNLSGDNNFSGINDFTGPTTMSGTFEQNGESTFNGPTHFNGSVDITETLDVTAETRLRGETTVEANLNVINNGKIKVGTNMTLTPSSDGGSILFQDGSQVTSVGGTVQTKSSGSGRVTAGLNSAAISTGNALISVDDLGDWSLSGTNVTLQTIGGTADLNGNLDVSGTSKLAGRVTMNERLVMSGTPTTSNGSFVPNMYMDGNGFVWRTTWTP